MADKNEDPECIIGSDSSLPAVSLPIKQEMDIISKLPACSPSVKLEYMSVSALQQHLLQKKENIAKMNDEVLAIEHKLQDVDVDPINPSNDLNMSENLLLLEPSQHIVSGTFVSSLSLHGSKENPVTLSSSDDEETTQTQTDDEKTTLTQTDDEETTRTQSETLGWWADKDRYMCDSTDANAGYSEPVDKVCDDGENNREAVGKEISVIVTDGDDSDHFSFNFPNPANVQSEPYLDDINPETVLETAFSQEINKKKVTFAKNIATHRVISSDDSCEDVPEPLMKRMRKSLRPQIKSKQKFALTKTMSKDGSKSLSANISFSSTVPAASPKTVSSHSQDSGIFTHSQDSQVSSDNSLSVGEKTPRKRRRGKTTTVSTVSNLESSSSTSLVSASTGAFNTDKTLPQVSLNFPFGPRSLQSPPTSVASRFNDIMQSGSGLSDSVSPAIIKQNRAVLHAALDQLFDQRVLDDQQLSLQVQLASRNTPPSISAPGGTRQPPPTDTSAAPPTHPAATRTSQLAVIDNTFDVGAAQLAPNDEEDVVTNYQFESQYSSLVDLKAEMEHPAFNRVSKGLRGLVSTAIVSDVDFEDQEPWEIPGLPFDFGDGLDIKDATAMLTNDWLERGLALPDTEFTLKQVNDFLRVFNKREKIYDVRNSLTGKMNRLLGQEFYLSYQWMDTDERVLTDKDILFFLERNNAESLAPNMAPWP